MSIIADNIEKMCRQIIQKMKKHSTESTPATFIGREMALVLDHIDKVRKRQQVFGEWFLEKELFLNTQIMKIDERYDLLPDWLERTRLKNEYIRTLDGIKLQAQRHTIEEESALQRLQVRLLELLNMYDQLSTEHGDTKSIA